MKQEVSECLEDFDDRVQHDVRLGFKGTRDKSISQWATELFLKGVREKEAAIAASEK